MGVHVDAGGWEGAATASWRASQAQVMSLGVTCGVPPRATPAFEPATPPPPLSVVLQNGRQPGENTRHQIRKWYSRDGLNPKEGKGPQRRPQQRLDRRLEEVAKAVGGGYCRLQMPLRLALGVRGTVAGHRLRALEGGGRGTPPPSNASLLKPPPMLPELHKVPSNNPFEDLTFSPPPHPGTSTACCPATGIGCAHPETTPAAKPCLRRCIKVTY